MTWILNLNNLNYFFFSLLILFLFEIVYKSFVFSFYNIYKADCQIANPNLVLKKKKSLSIK